MSFQPDDLILNDCYRIEALAGRGAFAEVYRATHLPLNAVRALKVLRRDAPGLGSTEYSDYRQRFQLEAQLGAQLDHPNVIRIHDFQPFDETLALVMEYAPGGSLLELLHTQRKNQTLLPVAQALRTGIDVAQGLGALHDLDVVHRDLKPSNILFDAQGRAKVADLGLAQI
ncbi:MAG: serine/threonine protein kinase, partial [Anaerolineae bacterium]|nr:serine/threonine protein kinase [Anaerolineae bacterium]